MSDNTPATRRLQLSKSLPADTHAAALSVEIRSPLAQIELAASQLFREALTPSARAQSEQIFQAVSEIDGLVERMLRVLVPPRRGSQAIGDVAPVVAKLRRRFVPALAACGVEWKNRDVLRVPVHGNLEQVRRVTTELLHLALHLAGDGGQFTLALEPREQGLDVALFCRRSREFRNEQLEEAEQLVARSQAIVLEGGGRLSGTIGGVTSDLRLEMSNDGVARTRLSDPTDDQDLLGATCRES